MDYNKHYTQLISKCKQRDWSRKTSNQYVEQHHIIPRSLGGSDNHNNLVFLTAREHYIAHLLLAKIYGGTMWYALRMFNNQSQSRMTGSMYQTVKEQTAKMNSKLKAGMFAAVDKNDNTLYIKNNDPRYISGDLVAKSKGVLLGKPKTNEHKAKLAKSKIGSNNPMFRGYYHTPNGVFESSRLASNANNCTNVTVINRCNSNNQKFNEWYFTHGSQEP